MKPTKKQQEALMQQVLDGMTWDRWQSLMPHEQQALRAEATPSELAPYLGWRVEVVDHDGAKRRFIVGQSTGWRPCFLEIARRTSLGGGPADSRGYASITRLYKVR